MGEITALGLAFAGYDKRADVTGDGIVDISDLVIVGSNFGKVVR